MQTLAVGNNNDILKLRYRDAFHVHSPIYQGQLNE